MHAGQLTRRISLEEDAGTARNALGEHVPAWRVWGSAWAAIEPLTGQEIEDARQVAARVTTKITVRFRPGLHAGMRARYGSRVYEIEAVLDEREKHVWHGLLCRETP